MTLLNKVYGLYEEGNFLGYAKTKDVAKEKLQHFAVLYPDSWVEIIEERGTMETDWVSVEALEERRIEELLSSEEFLNGSYLMS